MDEDEKAKIERSIEQMIRKGYLLRYFDKETGEETLEITPTGREYLGRLED